MKQYFKNFLQTTAFWILTIGPFFSSVFATVSLETLDIHPFEHILSFLPLKNIIHSREICHKFNNFLLPETLARTIDIHHKNDRVDFFEFDFSIENRPKKLLQLSEFFTPVSFPFLRILIKDETCLEILNTEAFRGKLKNVKSFVLGSNLFKFPVLENFVSIIEKTGLTCLSALYLSDWQINPEELAKILVILPKLEGFGLTSVFNYATNYDPEILTQLSHSPYAAQYTHLIFPTIKFMTEAVWKNPGYYESPEKQQENLKTFCSFKSLKTLILKWDFNNGEYLNSFKNALPNLKNLYTTIISSTAYPMAHFIYVPIEPYINFNDFLFGYNKTQYKASKFLWNKGKKRGGSQFRFEDKDKIATLRQVIQA